MRLFIDDIRDPKDGREWTVARTYQEAVNILVPNLPLITEVSFDHDLGDPNHDGYDVACLIERMVQEKSLINVPVLHIHSKNPVGRQRLKAVIDSIHSLAEKNARAEV